MPRNLGHIFSFPEVSSLPSPLLAKRGDAVIYKGVPFVHDGLIWRPIPDGSQVPYWRGLWYAFPGSTTIIGTGITLTATGTATSYAAANTSRIAAIPALEFLVTTASTSAVAGFRINSLAFRIGAIGGASGLYVRVLWRNATGGSTATTRGFCGLSGSSSAPTDVNPSTLTNIVGIGWDSGDTNLSIMFNNASGTATKVNLGSGFPRPTADRSQAWELQLLSLDGTAMYYAVKAIATEATASGVITTDLPNGTTLLTFLGYISVGGTSSVIGVGLSSIEIVQIV